MKNNSKRNCPRCHCEMLDNAVIKDYGINTLSYLELIIKDENFKKSKYTLRASYCPKCGHVELWVDFDQYEKLPHPEIQSAQELKGEVERFANFYKKQQEQLEKENKQQTLIKELKEKARKQKIEAKRRKK